MHVADFPPRLRSRFAPERLLGSGGFGAVYLVEDKQLARPVALKLLHLDLSDAETLLRFQREARVTG